MMECSMKILVPGKRAIDYTVNVRAKGTARASARSTS